MDHIREQIDAGRRAMIDAFGELTTLALRAGVEPELITALHGRFFDGNVAIKTSSSRAAGSLDDAERLNNPQPRE